MKDKVFESEKNFYCSLSQEWTRSELIRSDLDLVMTFFVRKLS